MSDLISRKALIESVKTWDMQDLYLPTHFIDLIEDEPSVTDTNVGGKWIPCSERLPENETEVEISCIRKYIGAGDKKKVAYFTARAFYTDGTMTTEDSSYVWEDCDNWEYDEEKDAYIIPEGWWECVTFSDEFGVVDAEVIAWMPLPEPYNADMRTSAE